MKSLMSDQSRLTLSVLMPAYNEQRTLRAIVKRVLAAPIDLDIELICVDDCSQDRSWELLQELSETDARIRIFRHELNRGKGAAVRTAIAQMTGDIAVVQDSDLEYDPADFPKLLKPILDGRADAVFGSRFAASPETAGVALLALARQQVPHLADQCPQRSQPHRHGDLLQSCERRGPQGPQAAERPLWHRAGDNDPVGAMGSADYEVPISYSGRGYAEGKNIGWRDGLQAIWLLLKFRFLDTRFSKRASQDAFETMAISPRVSAWTSAQFEGVLGKRVLEAGFGSGNITRHLLIANSSPLSISMSTTFGISPGAGVTSKTSTFSRAILKIPTLYEKWGALLTASSASTSSSISMIRR